MSLYYFTIFKLPPKHKGTDSIETEAEKIKVRYSQKTFCLEFF